MPPTRPRAAVFAATLSGLTLAITGCGLGDPETTEARPAVGECRQVDRSDSPAVAGPVVDCDSSHTAQTFQVANLPADFEQAAYGESAVIAAATAACMRGFPAYLGTDQSTAMRALVTWRVIWPTEEGWADGDRWYACEALGGPRTPGSADLTALPKSVKDLLADDRARERWLACVDGASVDQGVKVPCTRPHDWRAVTTIKLGEPADDYPGDSEAVKRTEEFCASSVQAWLNYPSDFDFGYTWFGRGAWEGGNRRSVCWAKTDR